MTYSRVKTYILILFGKPTFENPDEEGVECYEYIIDRHIRLFFFFDPDDVKYLLLSSSSGFTEGVVRGEEDVRRVFELLKETRKEYETYE